ncbi:MAG TPA: T9SS type A sorting domain-containing protein [Chitinophagaceae bacterium]|nr:T9SS type A sorting domain-containing protein [Chitinophagaceae bacterium]
MKKILLSVLLGLVIGFPNKSNAQCTVSDLGVNVKSFNKSTCQVVFDVTWIQEVNNGNKYAYLHFWTVDNYHTPAANWVGMYDNPTSYPEYEDLVNSLATISIFENGSASPFIGTTYLPDPTVPAMTTGLVVNKTNIPGGANERMTISNIIITLPSCTGIVTIKGDVWASQAANGKNVHCATQGLSFDLNNPSLAGFKVCEPRSYNYGITNNSDHEQTIYYNLYKDDGDNVFEPGTGETLDGVPIFTSSNIVIAPHSTVSGVNVPYPGNDIPGENASLWMEVINVMPASPFVSFKEFTDPGCIPLPLIFKSFTASRNMATVNLNWTTAVEVNNQGFFIERKYSSRNWEVVGFVNTKTPAGNSEEEMSYFFTDNNTIAGVSEYRIKQVDMDGKTSYTAIRLVKGYGQASDLIIYPNPSANGQVNVVFEKISYPFNVELFDMNGRLVKKWMNFNENRLTMTNVLPGVYTLKVWVHDTQEQITGKIIVSR